MEGWTRVTRNNLCPVCGHDTGCEISSAGVECRCRRSDVGAIRPLRGGVGWLHKLKDYSAGQRPTSKPSAFEHPKASPDVLHEVYEALLNLLDLSPEHLAHLTGPQRKLSRSQVGRRGYRSLHSKGRSEICLKLEKSFGTDTLLTVPGFFISRKGPGREYTTIAGPEGLLIPVRDVKGRIAGIQIRPNYQKRSGSKYLWLSSQGKDGPGPGGFTGLPAHVSKPRRKPKRRVWITEGPLKAARRTLSCALAAAGFNVYVAKWNETDGKGIDDLLLSGSKPELKTWTDTGFSKIVRVPASVVPIETPTPKITLEEAHQAHFLEINRVLSNPRQGTALFLQSGTGTGKTQAALDVLKGMFRLRKWPKVLGWRKKGRKYREVKSRMRVLFAADNREQIDRIMKGPGNEWLRIWESFGPVAVRVGRDKNNCNKDKLKAVNDYGTGRHSIASGVCKKCDLYNAGCVYWESVDRSHEALIVLATKDAVFFEGPELKTFDVMIVEEDLRSCIFEDDVILSMACLNQWREGMNHIGTQAYPDTHPHRRLISRLVNAIAMASQEEAPLISSLRSIVGGRDALISLVEQAVQIQPEKMNVYPYELPMGRMIPIRLMKDLLKLLVEEVNRPEVADTRLWLSTAGIRLFLLKHTIVSTLRKRTLINMDATPSPILKRIFPNANVVKYNVPENQTIIQIGAAGTDPLYTQRTLWNPNSLNRLNTVLQTITKDAKHPAIFCHKAFNPSVAANINNPVFKVSNPNVTWGHFGKDNRAVNNPALMDADVLVVVGLYCHSLSHHCALAHAVRNSSGPVDTNGESKTLKPYHKYIDSDNMGLARRITTDPDPFIQEVIDHQITADVIQAIGRARPSLRKDGPPLQVYIITAYPITGLPVDRLTTITALGAPTIGTVPPQAINWKRRVIAWQKIIKVIPDLWRLKLPVTIEAVHRLSGVKKESIMAFYRKMGFLFMERPSTGRI